MSFWKNKKVLVTGGAGFIGSHLVEYLVQDSAIVTVADNLERGNLDNLHAVIKNINFQNIDLRVYENCLKVCRGQEVVLNLAAKVTGIEYNRTHQRDMFESNMILQQIVIKAAAEVGVHRFLQVSTACIYPHDASVPTPESEGTRGEPEPTNSGYGWAKRMGERLAEFYAHETPMEIAMARPFNAYGPRDYYDKKTSHAIPALIRKVLEKQNPVEVWGSGNQSRVFIHARDVALGMKLIAEKYPKADPINIGNDNEITIKELLKKIQDITGIHNPGFFNTAMPEGYPRRAADTTKLKQVTGGFVPQISIEQGLTEMIEFFRKKLSVGTIED
jgi:GDP-L-fucose synthase